MLGECEAKADPAQAERRFRRALLQAQDHGDAAQALRAAMSLARLPARQCREPARIARAVGGGNRGFFLPPIGPWISPTLERCSPVCAETGAACRRSAAS